MGVSGDASGPPSNRWAFFVPQKDLEDMDLVVNRYPGTR